MPQGQSPDISGRRVEIIGAKVPYIFVPQKTDRQAGSRLTLEFATRDKGNFLLIDGLPTSQKTQFILRNPDSPSRDFFELSPGQTYEFGREGLRRVYSTGQVPMTQIHRELIPGTEKLVSQRVAQWVSGKHLIINIKAVSGSTQLDILEAGSSNGTSVTEEPLFPGERTQALDLAQMQSATRGRFQGTQAVGMSNMTKVTHLSDLELQRIQDEARRQGIMPKHKGPSLWTKIKSVLVGGTDTPKSSQTKHVVSSPAGKPAPAINPQPTVAPIENSVDAYLYEKGAVLPQSRLIDSLAGGEEGSIYLMNGSLQAFSEKGPTDKYPTNEDGVLLNVLLRLGIVSDGVGTGGGGSPATRAVIASCRNFLSRIPAHASADYEQMVKDAQGALRRAGLTNQEGVAFGALRRTATDWEGLRLGDVRFYIMRKNHGGYGLQKRTVDQSMIEMPQWNHLNEVQKMGAPQRNGIYNFIQSNNQMVIEPFSVPAQAGDVGLVVCDGVHECLTDEEMTWFFNTYYEESVRRGLNFCAMLTNYAFLKHDPSANIVVLSGGQMIELLANVADNGSAVLIR